jgi:hypothetical protein
MNPWEVGEERFKEGETKCPRDGCIKAKGHDDAHQLGAGGYDQNVAAMGWLWWIAGWAFILFAIVIGGQS